MQFNSIYIRRKAQDMREEIYTLSHIVYKKAVELDDLDYFKTEMGKLSNKYNQLYRIMSIQRQGLFGVMKKVIRKITY